MCWSVCFGQIPGSCTMLPSGSGVANTDLYIYVMSENVGRCVASGSLVLAYASNCQRDQLDRPTFGLINFCPTRTPTAVDSTYATLLTTATHEVMHVLGELLCAHGAPFRATHGDRVAWEGVSLHRRERP